MICKVALGGQMSTKSQTFSPLYLKAVGDPILITNIHEKVVAQTKYHKMLQKYSCVRNREIKRII